MNFIKFDELTSTNDYLRRKLDIEEYDVIVAKTQKNGKGRRGSVWISPEGSALFSFGIKYREDTLNKITIFTGYVIYEVLKKFISENNKKKLTFKWPNDIYYENRKIGGILCEKVRDYVIVGIGLNINNNNFGDFGHKAVSLIEITGKKENIDNIIKETVLFFKENIKNINKEWQKIISTINENSYLKNKVIKIKINGNMEDKAYRVSRIERNGKISILGKGDLNEREFDNLEFEII